MCLASCVRKTPRATGKPFSVARGSATTFVSPLQTCRIVHTSEGMPLPAGFQLRMPLWSMMSFETLNWPPACARRCAGNCHTRIMTMGANQRKLRNRLVFIVDFLRLLTRTENFRSLGPSSAPYLANDDCDAKPPDTEPWIAPNHL